MNGDRKDGPGFRGGSDSIEAWLGRTLKLESDHWPRPRSVEIVGVSDEDLLVRTKGDPPLFSEIVRLRAPGAEGAKVWLTGEVVALERIRESRGGVKITIQLIEEAKDAIQRLPPNAPHTDMPPPPSLANGDSLDDFLRQYTLDSIPPLEQKPKEVRASSATLSVIQDQENVDNNLRATSDELPIRPESSNKHIEKTGLPRIREHNPAQQRYRNVAVHETHPNSDEGDCSTTQEQLSSDENLRDTLRLKKDHFNHIQALKYGGRRKTQPEGGEEKSGKKSNLSGYSYAANTKKKQPYSAPDPSKELSEENSDDSSQPIGLEPSPECSYAKTEESSEELPAESLTDLATGTNQSENDASESNLSPPRRESKKNPEKNVPHALFSQQQKSEVSKLESSQRIRSFETRASTHRKKKSGFPKRKTAPAVGIDFGTSNSKIAVFDRDEVVLIEDKRSYSATRAAVPSVVALSESGNILVGETAREMLVVAPERVITSVKRVMGISYYNPLANGLLGSLACPSKAGPNDSIVFNLGGKELTVAEVSAYILKYLVALANDWTGTKITRAIMTIPVEFDIRARRELGIAARMAGIEVIEMIQEPVAAVMGLGFDGLENALVAVHDFGGGTFDASIVEVGNKKFNVLGAAGDRWLGGDDLDGLLARHTADVYKKDKGISLHNRLEEYQRLLFACEETKRLLSALDKVDVIMPDAGITADGPQTLVVPIAQNEFDELAQDIVISALAVCDQAMEEARCTPQMVSSLLLTGGTSRVPVIRNGAERYFGRKGIAGIHPEHAVVIGAALKAALTTGEPVPEDFAQRLKSEPTLSRSICVVLEDGKVETVISENTPPPVAAHHLLSFNNDQRNKLELKIVEGPEMVHVGNFVIENIPPRTDHKVTFNIYFELTTSGQLYVTAQDRDSGQKVQAVYEL